MFVEKKIKPVIIDHQLGHSFMLIIILLVIL